MAQRVEVIYECDHCMKKYGTSVEATWRRTIAIDGVAKKIDLCEPDQKKFIRNLETFLEEFGQSAGEAMDTGQRRPRGKKAAAKKVAPRKSRKSPADDGGEAAALAALGVPMLDDPEAETDADSDEAKIARGECPTCGRTGFKNVGSHRARVHDYVKPQD